ncbi:MAG TPA: squalene/phytoene synthase family protein [Balneolales bacterium]|nr:squalene/phytoene synthase family protein [Balneolales bacterium]
MNYNILRYSYTLFRPFYERSSFHRSVIEELLDPELRVVYNYCRYITKEYAKTFYLATRFLPNEKQRAIFAVYALCRTLDNIVDEEQQNDSAMLHELDSVRLLEQWKFDLIRVYNHNYYGNNPVLLAFRDTIRHYPISLDLPLMLIDGVMMDLNKKRYRNFDELYDYSYKVASVVGLISSEIFGYENKKALDYAVDLGIAMQLTNILRDIGEDLERDRIYLPLDELHQFRISETDLFEHRVSKNFKEFMIVQIERARSYYKSAEKGIPMLTSGTRVPVYLAHHNYSRILDKIVENGFQVFNKRAYVSKMEKIGSLPQIWWNSRTSRDENYTDA